MLRKLLIVFFFALFPIYVQNSNIAIRKNTEKLSFMPELPSVLTGLLSLIVNSRNSKRMVCIFLTTLFLTLEGALLYIYMNNTDSRQRNHELKGWNSKDPDMIMTDSEDYMYTPYSSQCFKHAEYKMNQEHSMSSDNDPYGKKDELFEVFNSTSKYERACPWYLQRSPEPTPVTSVVYPLDGYFTEMLQNNPTSSLMKYEWARFASFNTFPIDSPARPVRLAQTGFYYTGNKDYVSCFSCNVEYGNWKDEDIPSRIHRQLNSKCKFLTGTDQSNVPIHKNDGPLEQKAEEDNGATASSIQTDGGEVNTNASLKVNQQSSYREISDSIYRKEGAKHPDYAELTKRNESFKDWPCSHIVSPASLVEAGFVYAGEGDCVRCFYCGLGLRNFDDGDEPWIEHARWSQNCQYVIDKKGLTFVRLQKMETDEVSEEPILNNPTIKNQTSDQLQIKSKEETSQGVIAKEKDNKALKSQISNKDTARPSDKASTQLKEENVTLKSQLTCKICMDRQTDTVLIPCGHFVTCGHCSKNLRKCAICRIRITSRVKAAMG